MSWFVVCFVVVLVWFFCFSHHCVHIQLTLALPEHFNMTTKASVCLKALLTLWNCNAERDDKLPPQQTRAGESRCRKGGDGSDSKCPLLSLRSHCTHSNEDVAQVEHSSLRASLFNRWVVILMLCPLRTSKNSFMASWKSGARFRSLRKCSVTTSVMDIDLFGHNLAW